jgi:two-component system LytT family response regulator
MIKAIVLDKDPHVAESIRMLCMQTSYISCVKLFTEPGDVIRYLKHYPADLLYVNIKTPMVSNAAFRKLLPVDMMIIFTGVGSDNAVEAFDLAALDFLAKPFSFERFMQSAAKVKTRYTFIHQYQPQAQENLSLRVDYSLVKIPLSNILYIEGMDDYIRIYMDDQKPVITRLTMKAVEEKLPRYEFIRVHRSYIVPVNKIKSVRNKVIFVDKLEIRLGNCYEEKFYNMITNKTTHVANPVC